MDESEEKKDVIQNIADLIISEATNVKNNDLVGAIYHVKQLVVEKLIRKMEELRQEEKERNE